MQDLEQIYKEHSLGVYKFLLKLSGNRTVAEELTQETFYKAVKNIDSFRGTCKLYVWLCQIAKNEYISYLKKREHKNLTINEDCFANQSEDFEKIFEDEQIIYIHKALHIIDEPYKEVFSLRVFAELSFVEIANLFGKSDSWARVTYFRAKEKILNKLKEENNYEL